MNLNTNLLVRNIVQSARYYRKEKRLADFVIKKVSSTNKKRIYKYKLH